MFKCFFKPAKIVVRFNFLSPCEYFLSGNPERGNPILSKSSNNCVNPAASISSENQKQKVINNCLNS